MATLHIPIGELQPETRKFLEWVSTLGRVIVDHPDGSQVLIEYLPKADAGEATH